MSLITESLTIGTTETFFTDVLETETVYSTTYVETVTTTVTEQSVLSTLVPTPTISFTLPPPDLNKKKRHGGCGRKTSTVPVGSSVAVSTFSTTLPSSVPSSTASNCPKSEDYSSACSCISAVATTRTVTAPALTSTSVIYRTVNTTIPSTSMSTMTMLETVTVTTTVVSTHTTTLTTAMRTTTTRTITASPVPPTQTSQVELRNGRRLVVASGYVQHAPGQGVDISVATAGGQPWLTSNPEAKLYLRGPSSLVGVLSFETDAQAAASNDPAVTCSIAADGRLSCQSPSTGFDTIFRCGAYLYLAKPGFPQSGCEAVDLYMIVTY